MPNTEPTIDSQGVVDFIRHQAAQADNCNVFVVACVSKNREGKELAEIGQLVKAGAVAFTDDGAPIYNPELMRRAFEYCLMFDKPVLNHSEIRELTEHCVMHEGLTSLILGLSGMPAAAEDVMASRDIALADATGGRFHLMHVSTAGSVDVVRRAKRRGVRVTTEATPHHFTLTDECLRSFDPNFKMNPPLARQRARGGRRCRAGRRHHRRYCHRPRPARQGKEDAGTGPGAVRRGGFGNGIGPGGHETDKPRPSGLVDARFKR